MTRNLYFKHGPNVHWVGYIKLDTKGKATHVYPNGGRAMVANGQYSNLSNLRLAEKTGLAQQITAREAQMLVPCVKITGFRKNPVNTKTIVIIPTPQKFTMVYTNSRGETNEYTVTPIEKTQNGFTAYAFGGKGIRTFLNDRVVSIK